MAYDFYAGDTFTWAGNLQLTGSIPGGTSGVNGTQPDFSQWTLSASFFDSGGKQFATFPVTNASDPTQPSTNGLVYSVISATGSWPIGKATLYFQFISETGIKKTGPPNYYRIKQNPMNSSGS